MSTASTNSITQEVQKLQFWAIFCFKLDSSLVQALFKLSSSLARPGLVELSSSLPSSRAELRANNLRAIFEPSHFEPKFLEPTSSRAKLELEPSLVTSRAEPGRAWARPTPRSYSLLLLLGVFFALGERLPPYSRQ